MRNQLGSFCVSWKHHARLDADSASRDIVFFRYHALVLTGITPCQEYLYYHDRVRDNLLTVGQ